MPEPMAVRDEDILNNYANTFSSLTELYNGDIGVAVTDCEKYLLYKPSKKLDLNIPAGTPIKMNTAVYEAIKKGRRMITRGDKAIFGLPYIATAVPIYNRQQRIIGAAVLVESTEKQDALKEMAASLTDNITVLANTSGKISAQSQEIEVVSNSLIHIAQESQRRMKETDNVLRLIKDIAAQTNLLGLNAAIEAAHVGELGRGFGVVAEEIRKLAGTSADSIKKVDAIINSIQVDSKEIYKQMEQIGEAIKQTSSDITNLSSAIQQAGSMAEKLDELAEGLSANEK